MSLPPSDFPPTKYRYKKPADLAPGDIVLGTEKVTWTKAHTCLNVDCTNEHKATIHWYCKGYPRDIVCTHPYDQRLKVKVEEDKEGGYDEVAYGGTRGDRKPEIPNELTEGHLTVIPIKELRAGDEVHGLHHRHWKEPRTVEQVERWTGANVHVYWKRPKDRPIWLDVLSPNKMALIKCRSIKEDTPISMTVPKSGLIIEEAIGLARS
jgi:hypothetical protein